MNSGFPAARIELDRLSSGPVEWAGELPGEATVWGLRDAALLDPLRIAFRAEEAGSGGIRVQGSIEAHLGLTCRRCLGALERAVKVDFDLRFDPAVSPWEEEEGVYGLEPNAAVLDLSAALREELLLAVPAYPECPEGCTGLCPVCGASLRDGCGCTSQGPDPRWDELRRLASDGRLHTAEPDEETDGQ